MRKGAPPPPQFASFLSRRASGGAFPRRRKMLASLLRTRSRWRATMAPYCPPGSISCLLTSAVLAERFRKRPHGPEPARLPHHLRLPQAPPRRAIGPVGAGPALVPSGRARAVRTRAVDGTKLKANASRHKAMSYGRMKTLEPALAVEVEKWLSRAAEADAAEDSEHGADRRGDEMPDWMADKQRRLEAIRAAKAALEAEAADPPDPKDESGPGASSGMRWQGRALRSEDGGPPDRAQRNFTDPDSRILPTRDGFVQGYNGQIAVDAGHQVIVAHRLVTTWPTTGLSCRWWTASTPILGASRARSQGTPALPPRRTWRR